MSPATTELAAVIGDPVSHSLSPSIFRHLSQLMRRDVDYRRVKVPANRLEAFFRLSRELSLFKGWNVTIPHKEEIAVLVETLSPAARAIGAVNVVEFRAGKARGHNTDWLGVTETIREAGMDLRNRPAVLYGAGGAARAVAFALAKLGANPLYLANRSAEKAKRFCDHFVGQFPKSHFQYVADISEIDTAVALLVNSTPVGMKGFPGTFRFPKGLASDALAFDLIYRPANTLFLRAARGRGLRTVNGLDMLLWQAIATWEIWFGAAGNRLRTKKSLKRRLLEEG